MLQKIGYMEEDNIIEKKPWRGIPLNTRIDGGKFITTLLPKKGCIYQMLVQYVVIRNYIAIILC